MRYEGYGPGGVAVIVEALTDNRNRTASNVRALFTKYGGNLGETGSVAFMFPRGGEISYKPAARARPTRCWKRRSMPVPTMRSPMRTATSSPAPSRISARCPRRWPPSSAMPRASRSCGSPISLTPVDQEKAESLMKLVDALDEDDDVQNVFSNADISDEVMAKLNAA